MGMELWLSLIFSVFGAAYFLYGKNESDFWFMMAGGGLTFYGYFMPGIAAMLLVGALLLAAPFVARRMGY